MKLEILERFMLLNVLPPDGDLRTMRVVHEMRQDLGLTAQEIKDWEVKDQVDAEGKPTGVAWNDKLIQEVEIDVAGVKTEVIVEVLRKLDKDKKLTAQHLPLCDKFPFEKKAD